MFESVRWTKFQNEVPDFWARVSKQCRPFNLEIPVDSNWKHAKKRVLFVLEHIATEDLNNKRLLSGASLTVLRNCYQYAQRISGPYGFQDKDVAFSAINFNFFKNYHLDPDNLQKSMATAAKRVREFIAAANPTHVVIVGDRATKHLLNQKVEHAINKHGWVHTVDIGGKTRSVVTTPEYSESLIPPREDEDESFDNESAFIAAYQLGFFSRCLCSLICGKIPWQIDIKPNAILIDSIKKFDRMMELVEEADRVAFDTETANLNRIKNKLLILQFSVDKDRGFVLPYLHKDTPFSPKEIQYIRKRLRAFFMKKVEMNYNKYLIAFNAKFDITVVKQALGIPFMYWPVYDVQAGEHCHDETLRFFEDTEYKMGNLAQTTCVYGNDFYYTAGFSKKDRGNMEATDLHDVDFQNYCAVDSQSILAIHDKQRERAKLLQYREDGAVKSYGKDFIRVTVGQMSNNVHVFASMEHRGVAMDRKYLAYLKTKESPISQIIKKLTDDLNKTPAAIKANKLLLSDKNVPVGKGFWANKLPHIFDINKPEHKIALYVTVLGLEAPESKKTKKPSLGKLFKKKYEDVPEVAALNTLEKAKKLKSSYIDAFADKLDSEDGRTDGRMRPEFGFFKVLTGRSNSSNPSLQQVPQRGDMAKHIKRTFATPPGWLILKMDYSAHEIRLWSIISGDKVLASVFSVGRKLRQLWFKTGDPKYAKEIGLKGDVHKLNVEFFFGVPITKVTDDQRDAIKGVGFGAIYGKSYKTLAKELKKAVEFTKDLYDRFFGRFQVAAGWLNWSVEFGRRNLFTKSVLGRRRHLFGHLVGDNGVSASMDRRAKNSPIQGMGADFGHTGARIFERNIYEYLLKIKAMTEEDEKCPIGIEVMVHDSIFSSAPFEHLLAAAQILQWCATLGMQEYYDKNFDLKFTVPCEIEMEFGASQDKMYKWDWSLKGYDEKVHGKEGPFKGKSFSLDECIKRALKDHCELYPNIDYDKAYKEIYASWNNSKVKSYLDKHYPILGDYTYEKTDKKEAAIC